MVTSTFMFLFGLVLGSALGAVAGLWYYHKRNKEDAAGWQAKLDEAKVIEDKLKEELGSVKEQVNAVVGTVEAVVDRNLVAAEQKVNEVAGMVADSTLEQTRNTLTSLINSVFKR